MSQHSYRGTFANQDSAARYDEVVYSEGSSADILWTVERGILRQLAAEAVERRGNAAYLDFACGTGRILSTLEDLVDSATGIDVSSSMLERARAKCRKAVLLEKDVTAPDATIEATYDLITAMRFLTNAEPELRQAALLQLHKRLKPQGKLIINTHGNPWSYRLALLPYHWLKDTIEGRRLFGYLSNREARRLLENSGFRIEKVIGMGFVPAKALPLLPRRVARFLEQRLAGMTAVQAVGLNQLFVCTKA